VEISSDPLSSAVDFLRGLKASAFLLWSDEDSGCQTSLALCKDAGIPCFDLTEGLLPLTPSSDLKPVAAPVIPKQETLEKDEEDEDEDEEEEEEDDEGEDEEDEEEYEEVDNVYFGIEAIAKVFAKAFAEELEARKKGTGGPQE
jgi:hypothetical protein